jgi:drug/metabolite transporter (DMT)-like permease
MDRRTAGHPDPGRPRVRPGLRALTTRGSIYGIGGTNRPGSVVAACQDGPVTRRGAILFIALGIAWGIPYLLIKVAVGELDPAFVVFGRSALGALLLLPLALYRKQLLPVLKRWRPLLVYTLVEIIVPWFFLSTAETELSSSTAGLLLAAVPLAGIAVAYFFGRPPGLRLGNWLGIVLGMLGVAALVGIELRGSWLAVGQIAIVVVGYALGPAILSKWMSDLPGIGVVAASLGIAAIVYMPVVTAFGGWPAEVPSPEAIWSVVALAVVCSALAFVLMFALIAEIGPMRMTTITYVNPAVAIIAGAIVLHEPITWVTLVGFVLVLGGSYLVTRRRVVPEAPPEPSAAPVLADGDDRHGAR